MHVETTVNVGTDSAVSFERDCDDGVISLLVEHEGSTLRLIGTVGEMGTLVARLRTTYNRAYEHEQARQSLPA